MQISSSYPQFQASSRSTVARPSMPEEGAGPIPTDTVERSFTGVTQDMVMGGVWYGAAGALPGFGMVSNFGIAQQAFDNGHDTAGKLAAVGVLANFGAAAAFIGGSSGNSLVSNIGLGMLGVSTLTGAVAGFIANDPYTH